MAANQSPISYDDAEIEIDLVEIFYLLWNNIIKVIAWFVIGGALAFAYSFFLVTPLYQATAKMYINSATNSVVNLSDLQISSQLRSDYKELLTSRELLEKVIEDLSLQYKSDQLAGMISIGNPTDTRIITATVTDPSPQEAADIANQLLNRATTFLPDIMKSDAPSIYEKAIVPKTKSSPSYLRNTAIGGMAFALFYCAVLIFKYLRNDALVTPDDVEKYLGVQPLAMVPESIHNKKKKNTVKSRSRQSSSGKSSSGRKKG